MLYKGDLKRLVPVNEELTEAGKRKREERYFRPVPFAPTAVTGGGNVKEVMF